MQLQTEAVAGEEPDLYAMSAVLVDADTGRVLYGKNADTPMAMASTTKIMTCILVLENADLDDELKVSSYATTMPKVKLYLQSGESYRVRDLLYSLMLESHNDSAVALAEHVGKKYLSEELQQKDTAKYSVEESKQAVAA
ncbi:MAG: D-alanyl-D-alanine carboxypeptidase family protein, partial [Acetatifactor sp.]